MSNEPEPTDNTADQTTSPGGATATMEPDSSATDAPTSGTAPPPFVPGGYGPRPRMQRPSPNGLTRDPYSALGGVASGFAQRYGLSTALVRLVFVVVLFATFFFALPIYLVAWAIIPRATVWPPEALRSPGEKFTTRDLGVLALVGALLAFLFFGVDGVGSVLVSITLIVAGAALLIQHERLPAPPAPAAGAQATSFAPPPDAPIGQPVPPRGAGRKWFLGLALAGMVMFFAALMAIPIALIVWGDLESVDFETESFDFRIDDNFVLVDVAPTDLADLPKPIDAQVGDVKVDLSGIDVASFEALSVPAELDIELGNGDVEIILPAGVEYSIDAQVDGGDIDVELDRDSLPVDTSSAGESIEIVNEDSDISLLIEVGSGDITIATAN